MDKPIYEIPVTEFPRASAPEPPREPEQSNPPTREFLLPPAPLTPSAPYPATSSVEPTARVEPAETAHTPTSRVEPAETAESATHTPVVEERPTESDASRNHPTETPLYLADPTPSPAHYEQPAEPAPASQDGHSVPGWWAELTNELMSDPEPTPPVEPVETFAAPPVPTYAQSVPPASVIEPVQAASAPEPTPVQAPAPTTWSLSQPEPAVAPASAPVLPPASETPLTRPEPEHQAPPAAAAPIPAVPSSQEAEVPAQNTAPTNTAPSYSAQSDVQPIPAAPVLAPPPAYVPTVIDEVADEWRESRANADQDLITALQEVLLSGASDLHVSANAAPMIRVDGGLRPIEGSEPWSRDKVATALHSIMTPAQQTAFEEHLELDFAYTISSNARFRVNIYQQRASLGAAFRLIPTEIKQLHELGIPDSVERFAKLVRGLVLVTGPTGSGKSTTLAALIDLVNRSRADHIMTVEDPIEFLHQNHKSLVNQREVGHDTHSFGAALKHVLRQDPDVILVGELRDLETISVALTAAETGHLVFATLHTQSAAQSIDRIIDVFPPHQQEQVRAQLASTLQGVVTQTLLKKSGGRGRVVATEVLVATPAINNLIREGKTYQITSSMQAGRELGMHTLDQHLADLVNSGQITPAAAYEKCQDPETLKRLIHRQESPTGGGLPGAIDFGDSFSAGVK
ncbi:type IV pilus twitching motility protein PilT [Diaminobutyricimonas sp. LJ205]|uniref:type IV pilus twitching motility protein PilT n=1 Tax=Diaminobutyricimonas sp. LJ205 TaxID=2683590 RepID=UPI002714EC9E|nr:type IV pilus twitching motility protein PilT [Diaminobutyricimonas sp. LJ205]